VVLAMMQSTTSSTSCLRAHVGERVVARRAAEVHGVDPGDLVAGGAQGRPQLGLERALGVGHQEARVICRTLGIT
jgi:hypothetical protein